MQREMFTLIKGIFLIFLVRWLYMTFGVSMDAMYNSFTDLIPSLYVSASWKTVIEGTLSNWAIFSGVEAFMYLMVCAWIAVTLVMDMQYNRPVGG